MVDVAQSAPTDLARLIGVQFDDPDEVIRAAIAELSVPALLMSMVHMTSDLGLFRNCPGRSR
jgi:4-hydroxyacetophenone monooxygenase